MTMPSLLSARSEGDSKADSVLLVGFRQMQKVTHIFLQIQSWFGHQYGFCQPA